MGVDCVGHCRSALRTYPLRSHEVRLRFYILALLSNPDYVQVRTRPPCQVKVLLQEATAPAQTERLEGLSPRGATPASAFFFDFHKVNSVECRPSDGENTTCHGFRFDNRG